MEKESQNGRERGRENEKYNNIISPGTGHGWRARPRPVVATVRARNSLGWRQVTERRTTIRWRHVARVNAEVARDLLARARAGLYNDKSTAFVVTRP